MPDRDPVTGYFLPNDWEAWSKENASDYRTTKHTRQCNRCSRWLTPTSFHKREGFCYQCRSLESDRWNRKQKRKRLEARKRKQKKKKKNE